MIQSETINIIKKKNTMHALKLVTYLILILPSNNFIGMEKALIIERATKPNVQTLSRDIVKHSKQLVSAARSKEPTIKRELLCQAATGFETVYKSKKSDAQARSEARNYLEGIYAHYPDLKKPRMIKMMAQEDKKISIPATNSIALSDETQSDASDLHAQTLYNSVENRNRFTKRIFGDDIERVRTEKKEEAQKEIARKKQEKEKAAAQKLADERAELLRKQDDPDAALLEECTKYLNKNQFRQCAENCWILLKSSTQKHVQKKAKAMLENLHQQKKNADAAFYLAALEKDNPQKMIDLFLVAENRRDLEAEQKWCEKNVKPTDLIDKKNKQNETKIASVISEAMATALVALAEIPKDSFPLAHHALAMYYSHQASVFLTLQEELLQKAEDHSAEALGTPVPKGGYSYPEIINNLGMAICINATTDLNLKKINKLALQAKLEKAERLFKETSTRGYNFGTLNLANTQKKLFGVLEQNGKLEPCLSSYIKAVHENTPHALESIENLLLVGIEEIPLNIVHRQLLLTTLKQKGKNSQLLEKKDFINSVYYEVSQEKKIPGNKEFYEGLYWYDRGDAARARECMDKAMRFDHAGAVTFRTDLEIQSENSGDALNAIILFWNGPKLDHPESYFLNKSSAAALDKLIQNKNIPAHYLLIEGYCKNKIASNASAIKEVSKLLEQAEELLIDQQNDSMRLKIVQNEFVNTLIQFARANQSPIIIYKLLEIALKRLEISNCAAQSYELKHLISSLTLLLNDDIRGQRRTFVPCTESAGKLSHRIGEHLKNHQQEEHYFKTLRSLQLILEGKAQSPENIDPLQSAQDALIYKIKEQAATRALHATLAFKTNEHSHALDSLRDCIKLFRSNPDVTSMYINIPLVQRIFNVVKTHVTTHQFTSEQDILYLLRYKMILIAHEALTNAAENVTLKLDPYCDQHTVYGAIMAAQELALGTLFKKDIAQAKNYLARAKSELTRSQSSVPQLKSLQEVEELIKICDPSNRPTSS